MPIPVADPIGGANAGANAASERLADPRPRLIADQFGCGIAERLGCGIAQCLGRITIDGGT